MAGALDADEGAVAESIPRPLVEAYFQPVAACADLIEQQPDRSAVVRHDDVDVAVVVDVAERRASTDFCTRKCRAGNGTGLVETSLAGVMEQLILHSVRQRLPSLGLDDVHGSVRDEEIG